MKKLVLMAGSVLLGLVASAALKEDPVAAAFPDWTGVTAKNHITGREISASDLRHKVAIVMEFDAGPNLQAQLVAAASLAEQGAFNAKGFHNMTWETAVLSRNVITLVVIHNARSHEDVLASLRVPKDDQDKARILGAYGSPTASPLDDSGASVYENVTFTGAPSSEGKRPYVYVLSPAGRTVLMEGKLDAAGKTKALAAVAKGKKEIAAWEAPWMPFVGNLPPEKANGALVKALEKGRAGKMSPLEPVAKALVKNILSKDEAVAREAQIQYDAIYQARGELVHRIMLEMKCPHRAGYDIAELLKYFPREKKRVEAAAAKIAAKPEYATLAKAFGRLMTLADPSFECKSASEAKKIIQELAKIKKKVEGMKETQDITIQNGAMVVEAKIDEVMAVLESVAGSK